MQSLPDRVGFQIRFEKVTRNNYHILIYDMRLQQGVGK